MNRRGLFPLILAALIATDFAYAGDSVPLFLPFQGRATDTSGQPIVSPPNLTVRFRIYPAAGACYIYEDTQSVATNGYGFFSVILGGLANRTGPANNFADVFNNDVTVADSCASTFNGAANEWRRLEIVVDGVALPTMQTIAASAFSINSNMLDGKTSAEYIQVNGAVTQANMATLVGTGDASALHHHDGLYMGLSGNNAISGNITSSGSFYGVGAGSTIGIGTASPIADFEIRRTSPSILLGATAAGGGTPSITFTSGATQRARIQASESTNEMRFYTGSTEAMRLDASQNLILTGSLQVGGTVGLGKYNNAQETTLITALTGMGATAVGTMWVNSQTNTFKFWDGTSAIGLGSSSYITSVTAGTGLSNSGTVQAPILDVDYGTTAGTAIQGNAVFGGDVTGGYTALTVSAIQGRPVDATAPTAGQVLTWNTTVSRWLAQTIQDSQLSSNVALKNAANIFTNTNSIQVPTTTNVGLILQTTDNNTTNSLLSIRNQAGTPIATVRPDAVPTATTDLTTKSYVDTLAGTKLNLSGGTMTGAIDMGSQQITNMANPTAAQHAVTRFYADANLGGRGLASTAPTPNQILKWNGSQWEPTADVDTGITALTGDVSASGNGSVVATLADSAVTSAKIADLTIATADIGNLQVTDGKIAGVSVSKVASGAGAYFTYAPNNAACGNNDVLKWNGSAWLCGSDNNGGGTVTLVSAGGGLLGGNITGTGTLSVNVGTGANQIVQLNGTSQIPAVDGSLLTFVNAATLRGVNLSTVAPTPGQVLKYNGSGWEAAADTDTGITALSGDVTASGSGSVAATIRNDRITTAMMRSAGIGLNRILMTDAATGNTIDFADNCSPGEVLKWVDATNGWGCSTDVGAGGIVTLVAGGVGTTGGNITGQGTINVDVGTGNNQILQLNGSAQIPAVDGSLLTFVNAATIRGNNVATTAPSPGQVLAWNGSAWAPTTDGGGDITQVQTTTPLLGGGSAGGLTLSIDVGTGNNQVLQLNGSAQIPAVDGSLLTFINAARIRGVNLSTTTPTPGQVLKYNGSAWEAAADSNDGGDITNVVAGTGLNGGGIFGDVTLDVDVGTGANQILQLNGTSQIPAVDGSLLTFVNAATIRGNNVATTAPSPGQVLAWNGSAWAPATDGGGDITQVQTTSPLLGGGSAGGLTLSIDVGTGNNQVLQLNGSAQIPAVDGSLLTFINAASIRGVNLSSTAPTPGQVLKYNGSAWEAAADTDSGITALSGDVTASGSGSVAATIRDNRVLTRMLDNSAIGLNRIIMTDAATGNSLTYADGCSGGDVLKWVDATNGWACASDVGAAGVVTLVAGGTGTTGGNILSQGTINVDVGTGNNQILQLNGSAQIPAVDGSLLTFINAASIRGNNVATTAPTPGQVLAWNGSAWAPTTDGGGDITQVQTTTPLLGGGSAGGLTLSIDVGTGNNQVLQLNGSAQIPAVDGSLLTFVNAATLRGVNLSTTAPTPGYVLKYNGSAWEAAADTNSGGTVTLVAGGTGTTGGSITGTGTINVDVGTGNNQVLQLNGSAQIPAVDGSLLTFVNAATIRGNNVATTAPSPGQVLAWNGSAWAPATDGGGDITQVQTTSPLLGGGSAGGLTLSIDVGTGNNQILQLNGSAQIPAVDGSLLTFINAASIRGVNLSSTAPTPGQVLKYNGSAWEAAADTDSGITALSGDVTASGSGSVAATIRDNRILTRMLDNSAIGLNRIIMTDAATGNSLTYADGCSGGDVLKWVDATNGWACASDVGAAGVVTLVAGGTGTTGGNILSQGTINVDVGTGNNQILQLNGSAQIPAVDGSLLTFVNAATIRGNNVATTAPTPGQVLAWNGSAWAPTTDGGGDITQVQTTSPLLGGGSAGGLTLSIDVGTGNNQILQLNGSAQIPAVDGSLLTLVNAASIRGVNLSTTAPSPGEILTYNGSAWEAAPAPSTGVTLVAGGTGTTGGSITGTGTIDVDVGTGNNQILQLNGSAQIPAVDGSLLTFVNAATIRGNNVATTAPTPGQVLAWNGSAWAPTTDGGGDITQVQTTSPLLGGGSAGGLTLSIDVGTGNNQILQLNGSAQIPAVDGSLLTLVNAASIRGVNLSTTAPSPGEILTYNGSAWEAAAAPASGISALSGDVTATGPGSAAATIRDNRILTRMLDNSAIGLNRIIMTDAATGNSLTYADGCSGGDVLKWVDATNGWACATDDGGAGTVSLIVAGTGLLSGSISTTGTLSVDVGTGANQIVQLDGSSRLPAVDGSLLTDLNIGAAASGTLAVDRGGTGAASLTDNRLLLGNGTAAIGVLAAGTAGQLLQSGGASDPAWSTATFPTGAATQYDFLYASAANTWSSFATANTGALVTSSTGVPSWASGAVANRVLRTNGTTISFAQIDPTTDIAQGTGAVTIQSLDAGTSTFGNNVGAAATTVRAGTGVLTLTTANTTASALALSATAGGFALNGAGTVDSTITSAGNSAGALTLSATDTASGTLLITGAGNTANAVNITATTASGGINMTTTQASFAMNGTAGGDTILSSAGTSGGAMTVRTTNTAGGTLLLTSAGNTNSAVNITATTSGGGITLTPTPNGVNGHTVISAGRLGIGSATPAYTLDVVGSAQFTSNVHALAFFYTSDARLKENFTPVPGLDAINRLGGYRFNWKKDHSPEIGLIAQEVEQVFPELVTTNANGYKSVKYGNLVAPLIQSTKELYGMCKANESQMRAIASVVERNQIATDGRLDALEQEVVNLRQENQSLRKEIQEIKSLLLRK